MTHKSSRKPTAVAPDATCPDCGHALDIVQKCCWKCGYRLCHCGRKTGSPMLSQCIMCDMGTGK